MSSTKPASRVAAKEPPLIPPLTRNGYVRSDRNARQIADCLDKGAAELQARARIRDEADPRWLAAETLVFLMRRADQTGDGRTRSALFAELTERCKGFFAGHIRGFTLEQREDIAQEVMTKLVALIFADDDRGDFAQVRFWSLLEARTNTAVQTARAQVRRFESLDAPSSDDVESRMTDIERLDAPGLGADDLAMISEGLAQLDPHLRQVFVMRYKLGMAVGKENRADEDPSDPSIAFHFNVSARTVGKWLAKAEAQLASYRKA